MMTKQFQYRNIFLPALLLIISLSSIAQQQFIHTATKANNYCNSNCTTLDIPDLNNNPGAIIWATPILEDGMNLNPHPIGVYYFQNQWRIFNLDQKALPAGSKFNVQYFTKPDSTHFKYSITNENIRRDGSAYIDHTALTNNPAIQFILFPNWIPVDGGAANRYEIKTQYDSDARKWFIKNINERYLYARVAYNIIISNQGNTVAEPVKGNPDISIRNPTIITKPAGIIIPDYDKPLDKKDIITKATIPPPYDFSKVQICIEEITNKSLPAKTIVTPAPVIPKIKSNGELEPVTTVKQPLSIVTNLMWTQGESISVGFLAGETLSVINKIKTYVKEWETYANIKFVFTNNVSQAMIKVGFKKDGTSWSWIGRDVLVNQFEGKTMNLGWVNDNLPESKFKSVVLHEFGHALGFIHEHQSPNADIPWDSAKVYSFYGGSPNYWNKAKVDFNIFEKYSVTSTNSSTYDKLSIMHYSFPAELTTDSSFVPANTDLSTVDKSFAGQVYPYPPGPSTATGVLQTGDDCDEIDFKVEYNVVNTNEISFILEPGRDRNNNILTWWKKIAIPIVGGEIGIEMQDGYSASQKVQVGLIDKARGIAFGKAKVLGVHTGLAYTWNAWPAIIGGCRVTLVWRRDSCKQ